MTLTQTLQQLEAAGSPQTRKTYARHGVGPKMFGVSYAVLGKLTKTIQRDHALALGLWASGNHDARVLATMVADPAQADARATAWCGDAREFVAVTGWDVVAELALASDLPDARFAGCLKTIEREIHQAPNHVRYAMNGALIAMGVRNPKLEKLAVAAAKRIGTVIVDHGDTDCKTPDAVAYIAKTLAHRAKHPKRR